MLGSLKKIARRAKADLGLGREGEYRRWMKLYDRLGEAQIAEIRRRIALLERNPLISILMPVYNVEERWLRKAIDSVTAQIYENWELCIADDRSPLPHIRDVLEEYAAKDRRIKVEYRRENGHISAASNSALELVTGEFTAFLDHDDELAANAIYEIAAAIVASPDTQLIYSDEDLIDENGRRFNPRFKPGFGIDICYAGNPATHLVAYNSAKLREVGGFRSEFDGSQDHDLLLRVLETIDAKQVHHIPRILYHWRTIEGSVALSNDGKSYAIDRARLAINKHFERTGVDAHSVEGFSGLHRAIYKLPTPRPKVALFSIGGKLTCNTDYPEIELISVEPTGSIFSTINSSADGSDADIFCFIDHSTTEMEISSFEELVGQAIQKGVGAVGGLVVSSGEIISAGQIIGMNDGVGDAFQGLPMAQQTWHQRLLMAQSVSAVSGRFMAVSRAAFRAISGFDEGFAGDLGATDLCLRLIKNGYRNIWTPFAMAVQSARPSPIDQTDLDKLRARWPEYFGRDPFYNPNLSIEKLDQSLAFPPRIDIYQNRSDY